MKNISLVKIGAFGLCRRVLYWSCLNFSVSNLCYRKEKPQKRHPFQNSPVCGQFGLVLSLLFYALFSLSAVAQEHEGEGDVEKIDVIGSHIKRTNVEGPSPVLVITREEIEMSGHNSLADVLRDLPVASLGGLREQSLSSLPASTKTSVRGMDSSNVLVLLNYRRIPFVGGDDYVDLSIIPLSAIEKVEILKDGASPLYGSDAVGGVINIITKKNQTGGQVNVQGSLVQRTEGNSLDGLSSLFDFWNWNTEDEDSWKGKGDKLSIDVSYGGSKNDINYLVGGQFRFNSSMYLSDRSFGQPIKIHKSEYGSPGSWLDGAEGSKVVAFKDCPKGDLDIQETGNQYCRWDYSSYMQFMPHILQGSAFAYAEKEMDSVRLSTTALYSYTDTRSVLAPPPFVGFELPVEVAQKQGIPATKAPVAVNYRPVYEKGAGPRKSTVNNHTYQIQLNGAMDITDTMELDGNLNISGSHYFTTNSNLIRYKKLTEMIKAGDVNFTLPANQKSDISPAAHVISKAKHSNLFSFEPKLRGSILEKVNQSLSFALGGLVGYQNYSDSADELSEKIQQDQDDAKKLIKEGKLAEGLQKFDAILGGSVGESGNGDRWFGSIYGELSLLSFDMLEVQLAGRTDYYYYSASDSASGFTQQILPFTKDWVIPVSPRLALLFQPIEEVKLRASWGMGFKAPSLFAVHQKGTTSYPSSIDYTKCPIKSYDPTKSECVIAQHEVTIVGNQNLEPEISESFNVGFVLQPIDPLFLTVDYFITKRKNILGFPLRGILKYEQEKGAEGIEQLKKKNINIERLSNGDIKSITMPVLNSSDFQNGLDLEVGLELPVGGAWDMGLKIEHIYMLYSDFKPFEEVDKEVSIPWPGENTDTTRPNDTTWPGMPRWRNRATLSMMNKNIGHSFHLTLHNIPGQATAPESRNEIDYHWEIDVGGAFTLNKQTSLIVGVKNILDTQRPLNKEYFGSAGYVNSTLYSIRGRTIDARLTYNF